MRIAHRILVGFVTIFSAAAFAAAQSQPAQTSGPKESSPRILADETFDLNTVFRHITEENFVASTSVGFEGRAGRNLNMQIGVDLRATKINVVLRNVTGTVRFRGSVQRIVDLINSRPVPPRPKQSEY